MENYETQSPEHSYIPQPPPPSFLNLTMPPQPVVRLSPFRHFAWMHQAFGRNGRYGLEVRILILTTVFALAGGATGGIVAAFTLHVNRDATPTPIATDTAVVPEQTANVIATPDVANDSQTRQPESAPVNTPRRRVQRREDSRARLLAIYNDLRFDLDSVPPKKKRGKKDELDY